MMVTKNTHHMKNRRKRKNAGYSIVFALAVMLVISLACMSLFLAMSSSARSAAINRDREQAKILAETLSNEVIAEQLEALEPVGDEQPEPEEGTLADYIYSHIAMSTTDSMGDWSWYNDDEDFHSKEATTKSFAFENGDLPEGSSVEIDMYWESAGQNELSHDYGDRKLYIEVSVHYNGVSGLQTAKATTVYQCDTKGTKGNECHYYWVREL